MRRAGARRRLRRSTFCPKDEDPWLHLMLILTPRTRLFRVAKTNLKPCSQSVNISSTLGRPHRPCLWTLRRAARPVPTRASGRAEQRLHGQAGRLQTAAGAAPAQTRGRAVPLRFWDKIESPKPLSGEEQSLNSSGPQSQRRMPPTPPGGAARCGRRRLRWPWCAGRDCGTAG